MEVVLGLPDVEFTQIQKVDKDARGDAQFIRTKAKTNVTHQESRTHGEETVCQLPIQVDDVAVYVEEREGTPCSGPIERAEGERKLVDAVRLEHVLREEV